MNDSDDDKTIITNQREYSRVDALIPMECKLVPPKQRHIVRCRVAGESLLAEFKSLPNPDDQLIAEWLIKINAKLDEIIRMMTIQHEGFNCLNITKVNISGGGMSFSADQKYSPGDVLEIKVMLYMQKPIALFLYGEVVDIEKPRDDFDTFVQFIALDEFIRDEIIRFVFETEREILRERRR